MRFHWIVDMLDMSPMMIGFLSLEGLDRGQGQPRRMRMKQGAS